MTDEDALAEAKRLHPAGKARDDLLTVEAVRRLAAGLDIPFEMLTPNTVRRVE